jgi:hypothetical protein
VCLVDRFWFYAGRCGFRCLATGFGLGGYVLVWTWLGWIWWICFGVPPTGFSTGSAGFSTGIDGSLGDGFGWCATGDFSAHCSLVFVATSVGGGCLDFGCWRSRLLRRFVVFGGFLFWQ